MELSVLQQQQTRPSMQPAANVGLPVQERESTGREWQVRNLLNSRTGMLLE